MVDDKQPEESDKEVPTPEPLTNQITLVPPDRKPGIRGYIDDVVDLRALSSVRLMLKAMAALLVVAGVLVGGLSIAELSGLTAQRVLVYGLVAVALGLLAFIFTRFLRLGPTPQPK